ncbi:50S ribosomal protein L13 [Candidatus Kuenenbacteria bacterium HGW-Kuenenbacteria-1]|uniref:Large ribosomal subunit protein uL13 n=1 Tax=Candidatus Kuenenbacteria bacterium HGW-Kuenenbacteria-1 TaxID=2013812 RepID=A0A2N1UMS2_9BACT|nr:MAG: 50S ribosomal protein L13 [Candidatus Kuenenbacteria bacterium HGW-Kuenenbacteria-1]
MKEQNKNIRQIHIIDATDKVLGRLSTKIAIILRGKNKLNFVPNLDQGDFVEIKNIVKIKITGRKLENKEYLHHTGYPGGLKRVKMKDVFKKDPGEILRKAVYQMLPKNKLRQEMIKRLKIN